MSDIAIGIDRTALILALYVYLMYWLVGNAWRRVSPRPSVWEMPPPYLRQCVKYIFSLPPSPLIVARDKSIAIYDSFVAAGRPLPPCLAVIPADSFRSVSLFKRCCNYTGFSICRRPDMIQTTATARGERELNG